MADEGLASEPVFVVLRAARGAPPGFMPPGLEGRWEYRSHMLAGARHLFGPRVPSAPGLPGHAVVIPTGRVEHRDSDGASAEVWEVHPVGGQYDPAQYGLPL